MYDVLIIGCGILGASTGYSCVQSGLSTIIFEQYSSHLHQYGGSFGTSRAWRTAYSNPIYADMMLKSLEIWKDIELKTSTSLLKYCGGLDFGPKNCKSLNDIVNTLKLYKHKYSILSSKETMKRFKPIQIPDNYISVYTPNYYGTINANKALNCIIKCSLNLGIDIKYNHRVIRIEKLIKNNNIIYKVYVENNDKYFTASHIIFAGGSYKIPDIINIDSNTTFKLNLMKNNIIKSTAFNIVYFKPKLESLIDNISNYPVWCEMDGLKEVCNWYGMITPKYTPFGVVYCMKVGDSAANVINMNDNSNDDHFIHIKQYMNKRFGINNWNIFECKKCYVSETKDDNFIIDRIDKNENIYFLAGSHTFKHAPQIGYMMKEFIVNNTKPNKLFSLDRFNLLSSKL